MKKDYIKFPIFFSELNFVKNNSTEKYFRKTLKKQLESISFTKPIVIQENKIALNYLTRLQNEKENINTLLKDIYLELAKIEFAYTSDDSKKELPNNLEISDLVHSDRYEDGLWISHYAPLIVNIKKVMYHQFLANHLEELERIREDKCNRSKNRCLFLWKPDRITEQDYDKYYQHSQEIELTVGLASDT